MSKESKEAIQKQIADAKAAQTAEAEQINKLKEEINKLKGNSGNKEVVRPKLDEEDITNLQIDQASGVRDSLAEAATQGNWVEFMEHFVKIKSKAVKKEAQDMGEKSFGKDFPNWLRERMSELEHIERILKKLENAKTLAQEAKKTTEYKLQRMQQLQDKLGISV